MEAKGRPPGAKCLDKLFYTLDDPVFQPNTEVLLDAGSQRICIMLLFLPAVTRLLGLVAVL